MCVNNKLIKNICIYILLLLNRILFLFSERVRQIQEKLEEFIQALNKEK